MTETQHHTDSSDEDDNSDSQEYDDEMDTWEQAFGLGFMLGGPLLSLHLMSIGEFFPAFLTFTIGIGIPILYAEGGRELQDSQKEGERKKANHNKKEICNECGWQNPPSNNYCLDCGSEI